METSEHATVPLKRWLTAQRYERSFWQSLAASIEDGTIKQLDWYAWKAAQFESRLAKALKALNGNRMRLGRVLEVGSGPIGIVTFLEGAERFAIDPLEDFFKESPALRKFRKPEVTYLSGTGEQLPFADGFFSLVIIDNVIDHTHAPSNILRQIHRVLDKDGLLYLTVNIHTPWGAKVHRLLAELLIDRGHPYSFTSDRIRNLLNSNQFKVCYEEIEDYHRAKQSNCRSKALKDKIKGYTGVSEFQYHTICQKATD